MQLIKTSLLNSIAVGIKLLTMLGLNKILAIYVGPVGYAAMGQFQNAIQVISTFASGAVNLGVTKYTAQYYNNEQEQHVLWQTAGSIALIGSLITSFLIFVFNKQLALWFLADEHFGSVFIWFGISLIFFVFNSLLLAILNGKKEIGRYVIANSMGSIFSLFAIAVMASKLELYGALIGLAVYQSLTFFVTIILCYKAPWFKLNYLWGKIDINNAKKLLKYTIMAVVTAVCIPASHILVRNYLGSTLGWDAAGYWEAMSRLSIAYLLLITTTLSVYYLPRLSELDDPLKLREEIFNAYKVVLPIAMTCSLLIYLFRELIISLLFTQNFIVMKELFAWQLIGDTLKISSWLLGYVYVAKGFLRLYVVSEVLFSFLFFFLVVAFESKYQLKATALAYALNYFLHFIFIFVSLKFFKVI